MTETVIDRYEAAEAELDDIIAMHLAAMRVMDSTRGGGWGTFRVDGLTDEQAERLPRYLAQYKGRRLESLYFDDDNIPHVGTGSPVDERHSRFSLWQSYEDPETGETRRYFKWDKELWDPVAAQQAEQQLSRDERRATQIKWTRRALIGLIVGVEYMGIYLSFSGADKMLDLERANAPQEEVDDAKDMRDLGNAMILGGVLTGAGYSVYLMSRAVNSAIKADQ